MKRLTLVLLLSVLGSSAGAQTQQNDESEPAQAPAAQMHAQMQLMREQMRQLHATTDPEERKRLMQAHMQSMRQGMGMMGSMQPGAMGHGGGMRNCSEGDTTCLMQGMEQRQQMMGERMGMMQMMMDQMMQQMEEHQRQMSEGADD